MKPTNRDPEAVTARLRALPVKDDRVRVSLRLLPSVDKQLDELARLRGLDRNTAISVAIAQDWIACFDLRAVAKKEGNIVRTCRKCGELIPTNRPRAKDCGLPKCKSKAYRLQKKEEGQRELSEKIERTEQALLELAQAHMNKVRLLGALSEAVADVAALQGKLAEVQAAAEQGDRTRMTAALTGWSAIGKRHAAASLGKEP